MTALAVTASYESASADERRMLTGVMTVLRAIQPRCDPASPEARAIHSQLRRFQRQLLMADARKCLSDGDSAGAVEWLKDIPDADRGPMLSTVLTISRLWPPLLLQCYRAKCGAAYLRRCLMPRRQPFVNSSSQRLSETRSH